MIKAIRRRCRLREDILHHMPRHAAASPCRYAIRQLRLRRAFADTLLRALLEVAANMLRYAAVDAVPLMRYMPYDNFAPTRCCRCSAPLLIF